MAPRLKEKFANEIKPKLKESFGISNDLAVPNLEKIVVNMGVKGAVESKAKVEAAARDLAIVTGQKPTVRKAKHSIAGFKLREGMPIGCAVTLRRDRMWEFFDRLVNVSLPRVRDFKGIAPKSFDGRGNFSLGIREQIIFPEIEYDKVERITGMNITICTTAGNDAEARALLTHLGFPFSQGT